MYALGVVLFELLAGKLPYDLERKLIAEAARIIKEDDPERLSSIDTRLRGDVETIVAKALEKERDRRYQSALDLGSDIRRYLNDEPIAARPPSAWYQIRKFSVRNTALVAGAVAAFAALLLGLAGTSYGLVEANAQRERAEASASEALEAQRTAEAAREAEAERAAQLELVIDFQAEQLADVNADEMGAQIRRAVLADAPDPSREALAAGLDEVNFTNIALDTLDLSVFTPSVRAIDAQFESQPMLRARLLHTAATTLGEVGLLQRSLEEQRRALDIYREQLGDEHPDTIDQINDLGFCHSQLGAYAEAERCYKEALEARRRTLGDEHPDTIVVRHNLASVVHRQGRVNDAIGAMRSVVADRARILGENDPDTLSSKNSLAVFLMMTRAFEEAEPILRSVLDGYRQLYGEEHPDTLLTLENLGASLIEQGKQEEVERVQRDILDIRRRTLGDDHPDTMRSINLVGFVLQAQQRHPEAEVFFREALERRRTVFGNRHTATLTSIGNLGVSLINQQRYDEAVPLLQEALRSSRETFSGTHIDIARSLHNLADAHLRAGNYAQATTLWPEALEMLIELFGSHHPYPQTVCRRLVDAHERWHEAEPDAGHDLTAAEYKARLDAMHAEHAQDGH